jgi:hypothetical protein
MSNAAFIQEVVKLTNEFRAQNGLGPLSIDVDLAETAQGHSEDMAYQDFFSHTGLDGSKPWDRAKDAGYESITVGENIAAGYATPQSVVQGWINSDGHRANMLNTRYNEIGVGYFYLQNDTGKINYRSYWTQVFGKGEIEQAGTAPATTASAPAPSPAPSAPAPTTRVASNSAELTALQYGASNPDLLRAFGYNSEALWQHYVTYGQAEGRSLDQFDEVSYLAGYDDLLNAFGSDTAAAIHHYVQSGYGEGRSPNRFQASQYIASHKDLCSAFGTNTTAAAQHFVQWGYQENRARDTFDEGRYLASNKDLIRHFGYDLAGATEHYITYGMSEGRSLNGFDPGAYLSRYGDLQAAFGTNLEAATQHFIEYGSNEGRIGTV